MDTPVIEFNLKIDHQRESGMYEISFDVYPVNAPSHPDRHIGYWNTPLPLVQGFEKNIRITWSPTKKEVYFNGISPKKSWVGEMKPDIPCRASLVVYDDQGARISEKTIRLTEELSNSSISMSTAIPQADEGLASAIWFLTWRCNFKCPYCWEVQRQARGECTPEQFFPLEDIVTAWNRLRPGILDITGGEPFLQPGFIDFLERLDDGIRVAITTNASFDLTEFVRRISPEKVFSMTISLHPTQRMSTDLFLGKCLLLKNRGFNITVNFVTWPEQMWLIPQYRNFFEGHGIRFHVDPYAPTPHFPFQWSEIEREFLRPYIGEDRSHWFGEVEMYPVRCSGGKHHINVQPNGDAYRCINDKILDKPMLGNIFDSSFKLNEKWTRCDDYYRCPGCDRDKIKVERLDDRSGVLSSSFSYTL